MTPLASERAIERAREIITLTEELVGDFRAVRDELDALHRQLRQSLVENEGSRSDVLESLFAGIDLIAQSDPGRTFSAFWTLLLAQEQSATLQESLAAIMGRGLRQRTRRRGAALPAEPAHHVDGRGRRRARRDTQPRAQPQVLRAEPRVSGAAPAA